MSDQFEGKKQLERSRIAELVKEVRDRMSLADVARHFGVSDSAVNYWLTARTGMSPTNQEKLADLLGWQYEDFKYYKRTGIKPNNQEFGIADKLIDQIKSLSPSDKSRVALAAVTIALDSQGKGARLEEDVKKKPLQLSCDCGLGEEGMAGELLRRYIVTSLEKSGYDMKDPVSRDRGFEEFLGLSFLESEQKEKASTFLNGSDLPSSEIEKLLLGFTVALNSLTGINHSGNKLRQMYLSNNDSSSARHV